MRGISAGLVLGIAALAAPALAFRGTTQSRADAKRFGLDQPEPGARRSAAALAPQAAVRTDQLRRLGAQLRFGPSGAVTAVLGRVPTRGGTSEQAARGFLDDYRETLGIDNAALRLDRMNQGPEGSHLLFLQTHLGLPVEFAQVKIDLSPSGDVLALHSSYHGESLPASTPAIGRDAAAAAVARDLGGPAPNGGTLAYLPVYKTGEVRLAWKFRAAGSGGRWVYYVDAQTGAILFRYDDLRHLTGSVRGQVYDIDPNTSGAAQLRAFANERVWVGSGGAYAVTDSGGNFNSGATSGKIYGGLRGTYFNVAHFQKDTVHYDNGAGKWCAVATPVTSPSPYPNGTQYPNSVVFSADVAAPAAGGLPSPCSASDVPLAAVANFSAFQVGVQDAFGDITDDDQVHVYDSAGERLASYMGARGAFRSAPVYGASPLMRLQIAANDSGQNTGFTVNVSSYLVLSNPDVAGASSNIVWYATMTADASYDEINVFYHLNKMHDYFTGGVDSNGAADISKPAAVMTHFGPNLANAFFNPDHNNIAFGDVGGIALDATVIHHEYTHYVIDKIYPIFNFGQNGALSEGLADYFSASSLNDPHMGKFVGGSFGEGSLRELACTPASGGTCASPKDPTYPCFCFPGDWLGEIHDDSRPLSQMLWELRTAVGQACADGLVFKSLFYFPTSFEELHDAMRLADAAGAVPACGAAGSQAATIDAKFANHMSLNLTSAYEPNDGMQTATDITASPSVTATIYPVGDLDYYSFGAAAGPVRATLTLPSANPGSYWAYGLVLMNQRQQVLAEAYPPMDVNPTPSGFCPVDNCQTSQTTVTLDAALPAAGVYTLLVTAAPTDGGSASATSSAQPYQLQVTLQPAGALSGGIVAASVTDNDRIDFSVSVESFVAQNYQFSYAQLLDHDRNPIPGTRTDLLPTQYLALNGPVTSANGSISGEVMLQPFNGETFSQRFPSLGTVYLEVFAKNALQTGQTVNGSTAPFVTSLGYSPALNLTTNEAKLVPYNNIFNPVRGEHATFKYETLAPGHVRLRLFTVSGSLVSTLVDADVPAGKGSVDWGGRNDAGSMVASGLYLLRLEGPNGQRQTQKVIVVK